VQLRTATIAEAARSYLSAGLCVLPARRDQKRPTVAWKAFQTRLPTPSEVDAWFSNGHSALCVLTGEVSGRTELIDFDNRGELFQRWCDKVQAAAPGPAGAPGPVEDAVGRSTRGLPPRGGGLWQPEVGPAPPGRR